MPRFQEASDQSLLVYFGEQITAEAHVRVVKLLRLLESQPIAGIRNLHPAYCSLLVKFDPLVLSHGAVETQLRSSLDRLDDVRLPQPRKVEIPVCYGADLGPDLNDVATLHGMTGEQVIDLHSSA